MGNIHLKILFCQELNESHNPFKLLNNCKFISYNNNLKIYLLKESKEIKCLIEMSYNIFESKLNFENKMENEVLNNIIINSFYWKFNNDDDEEEEDDEEEKK